MLDKSTEQSAPYNFFTPERKVEIPAAIRGEVVLPKPKPSHQQEIKKNLGKGNDKLKVKPPSDLGVIVKRSPKYGEKLIARVKAQDNIQLKEKQTKPVNNLKVCQFYKDKKKCPFGRKCKFPHTDL